jgi:hypothetical protein
MKTQLSLLVLIPVVTATTAAWAAPAVVDGETPSTVVAQPAPQAAPAADDPNIDRAFLEPTAMTQPAGSLTYNNYELLLHGFTYGITDRVQTSLTVLSPIVKDMPLLGIAAVKWQLLSASRFHLALQGSAGAIHVFSGDTLSSSTSNAYLLGAGAFATYCLREDCASLVSVNASYEAGLAGGSLGNGVIFGGAIVQRLTPHVKLLGEVTGGTSKVSGADFSAIDGALVSYGVRFHTNRIASDVGFIKPVSFSGDNGDFLLGLPFVSVSYRWN